uniref:Uncharacterized protein n=1 Tax=Branchiostoma floridae TaxID=7739 RepID=C3XSB8_BRAFL|eukprot:XP_002613037.1 hypothetical protein BRAFLDRAFT_123088 [Branchiostoma floridae]
MKLFVCMMLVTMVVMATLIDDSEGWRRRRRRRRGRLDVDADGTTEDGAASGGARMTAGQSLLDRPSSPFRTLEWHKDSLNASRCPPATRHEDGVAVLKGASSLSPCVPSSLDPLCKYTSRCKVPSSLDPLCKYTSQQVLGLGTTGVLTGVFVTDVAVPTGALQSGPLCK